MTKRVSDIDLMGYLDGELPPEEARELGAALEADGDAQREARALRQLGECVRTYAELETDDADAALSRVWERVEGRLRESGGDESAPAPRPFPLPNPDEPGAWTRLGQWLDGARGYFVTGAVAAAAAAALVIVVSGGGEADYGVAEAPPPGSIPAQPAALSAQPPEVESLEIYGGSGSVLTIPAAEDEGGGTAVIWLDREPPTEGPI